jgi:hypothetical protein
MGSQNNPSDKSNNELACDYCGRTELAYEMRSDKGIVNRCIPCLAIEQGQQQLDTPFSEFIDNTKHEDSPIFDDAEDWRNHRKLAYESARDWWTVLARIQDDDQLVKRDPDAIGTLHESTRTFLTNIMGEEAHYPPSEVAGSEVHASQVQLGDST